MAEFEIIHANSNAFPIVEALFQADENAPVFYSSGMLATWQNIVGRNFELAVLKSESLPVLALPIVNYSWSENITYPGWDNLNVLRAKHCTDALEGEFWQKLLFSRPRLVLTNFTQNHFDFSQLKSVRCIKVPMRKCPYIDLRGGWETLNGTLGKKLVRNIRQYGNKAKAAGINVEVKRGENMKMEEKLEGLKASYSFHNQRMAGINQQSKFTPEEHSRYHEEVLRAAKNVFIIQATNTDNERISWYYGLCNQNRLAWFNGGYNPNYQEYSLGTLLVAHLIEYALANNMHVFDFLRGNESYKQKWTQTYDLNETIYLAQTGFKNAVDLNLRFFTDTRKRMGGRRAASELIKVLRN